MDVVTISAHLFKEVEQSKLELSSKRLLQFYILGAAVSSL